MINVRCSLCDDWLPLLQISNLCPTCYKCRTIVKAYSADTILRKLEEHFLIDTCASAEASEAVPEATKETPIADDRKDYDKPKTRNNQKKLLEELKTKI